MQSAIICVYVEYSFWSSRKYNPLKKYKSIHFITIAWTINHMELENILKKQQYKTKQKI